MDAVFAKLDISVSQALQTLFPATTQPTTPPAQQRAHDFATHVSLAHSHLAALRSASEGTGCPPQNSSSDEHSRVAQEIEDIRRDIRGKNAVLEKHRGTLVVLEEKLRRLAQENMAQGENPD
ncbi:hypothetical protein GGI15_004705 [Coemansia interrupta]|uniref:Mediator of RNA polymerase II transcription subunit 9 n=1 Tax=Coemansia interrupta TaxID=1126814 RepID=A0A9W8LDA8_9FUNG|nr:hypothetical protein GGI15_004705 [Coemansia interrupta]